MSPAPGRNTSGEGSDMAVRIGIREIYDSVQGLILNVGALSRQIETLHTDLNSNAGDTEDLEKRLRVLETQKVVTPGSMWMALGVLATIAGALIALINQSN